MHLLSSLILLLLPFTLLTQELVYDAPLGGPLLVTGTFGELRSDHFHAGLDFRASVNTPVYAVAEGFVSRITVSPGGYGQAVYIDHPDGHRSVYGHLETLAPALIDTIRKRQFSEEAFQQNIRFDSTTFPVKRGDKIGGVGNRGHSFGAHLHFEMREIEGDAPVNPMAFGFDIADTRPAQIRNLRVYELDDQGLEVKARTLTPEAAPNGRLVLNDTIFVARQRVGLALKAYDQQNALPNWNGIYGGELYVDTTLVYNFRFDRIPFEQTEYLNAMTDYAEWVENTSWFHRFWTLPNQRFEARPRVQNEGIKEQAEKVAPQFNGVLKLQAGVPLPVSMRVLDHAGNVSGLDLVLLYQPEARLSQPNRSHQYFLPAGEPSIIDNGALRLELDDDALYRNCYFRYARLPDASAGHLSATYSLHDHLTPLHGSARLSLRPEGRVPDSLRSFVFLGHCTDDGKWVSHGGHWIEGDPAGRFQASISSFGDYGLFLDTIPPTVDINYFGTDLRRAGGFSLLVKDNVIGGRLDFRGTIDGKWVLLEYDGKNDKLTYNFDDGDPGPGQHRFELVVTDGRGNTVKWARGFRR
ncbi:peptidoglycan DD-metalloendopeptidase family protein [Neolewinella persica]|uniref:peptidoglycan DD-metalloendopeptidase family protein n=1 Tax=Neolewinella persica TaxID=70998 RepID=UPI0003719E1E|nr:peptidoglycan DD-metalloendopeptidase family protein [Neolewinella persica]